MGLFADNALPHLPVVVICFVIIDNRRGLEVLEHLADNALPHLLVNR